MVLEYPKQYWKKENKVEEFTFSDFKTLVIKTLWYWHKNNIQINGIELRILKYIFTFMVNLFLTGHQDNSVVKNSLQQMALGEKNRWKKVKVLGTQSCPTLCTCSHQAPLSMEFSRQNTRMGSHKYDTVISNLAYECEVDIFWFILCKNLFEWS